MDVHEFTLHTLYWQALKYHTLALVLMMKHRYSVNLYMRTHNILCVRACVIKELSR